MGVKWLLRVAKAPGVPVSPQDAELVAMALERLTARRAHRDKEKTPNEVICHLYKQQLLPDRPDLRGQGGMRELWLVQQLECPAAVQLLLAKELSVLEADAAMQALLERCLDYKRKNILLFSGPRFSLGDFGLKVLQVTHLFGSQERRFLGTLLEVELLPLADMEAAQQVMAEMVSLLGSALASAGLEGKLERVSPPYERYTGLGKQYSYAHAAVAYTAASATMALGSGGGGPGAGTTGAAAGGVKRAQQA